VGTVQAQQQRRGGGGEDPLAGGQTIDAIHEIV